MKNVLSLISASPLSVALNYAHKMRNATVQLEHSNGLLHMENEIIGEKLRGLYSAIQALAISAFTEGKVRSEIDYMKTAVLETAIELAKVAETVGSTTLERDVLRLDLAKAVKQRSSAQEEFSSLSRNAKEKLNILQSRIGVLEEEREKGREHGTKVDKQYKDLVEEYEKLRNRLKQVRQKRKLFEEFEEKVCKNCQKIFIENTNYNWSCKTHYSEYSGEMYWCCGLAGKEAPGCRISKHIAKDDDEEDPVLSSMPEQVTSQCSVRNMQSCKDYGHKATECPRDPNLRSSFDMSEELDRVRSIAKRKKVGTAGMADSVETLKVMAVRQGLEAFNQPSVGTSPRQTFSSDSSPSEDPGREGVFGDITKLRKDLHAGRQ